MNEWYQKNKGRKRELAKIRINEHRTQIIELKEKNGCHICDESYAGCLEFHHISSDEKDGNVADMVASGLAWTRIQAEIDLCVILCSNCHRKVHGGMLTL